MQNRKKDLHQKNDLYIWAIILGIITILSLTYLIVLFDIEIIRNKDILPDKHVYIFLITLSIYLSALVVRYTIKIMSRLYNHLYCMRFKELASLGHYEESGYRFHNDTPKIKHAVLLLHGFTASPQEFDHLIPTLQKLQLPYCIPIISGFGLNTTSVLYRTRYYEWFRSALEYYDNLKMFSEEVSVIGHSMGGLIACFLAQQRKVKHLILSGPGIYATNADKHYQTILKMPLISNLFIWLVPAISKPIRAGRTSTSDTLDDTLTSKIFQYLTVPSYAVKQLLLAQDAIDLTKMQFDDLSVLYGKHDITVDNQKFLAKLNHLKINYKSYSFENTAHNIFEDYEKDKVAKILEEILQKGF